MKNLKNTANIKQLFLPLGVIIALLIIWEVAVSVMGIEEWILPKPHSIFKEVWDVRDLLILHSAQTIYETLIGLALSLGAGILIATLIDMSSKLRQAIYPLLVISQTIPIIALAPLLVMWFGYGMLPKVLVIMLVCFFPIAISLADGYRLVDRDMIRVLQSMGASRLQIFKMVKIPAALPSFFTGLRIAGTYSVMGAVIGEWLGASEGLGILLTRSSQSFLTTRVFATIFVIVLLSLIIYGLIEIIAKWTMPWRKNNQM
ncbi:ABC transporter permease [Priestia koreensis]|uniref:ABC transporter permease n=1 Tax=Priestia koreensis TaxID=284581 RepID=A0A0M0KQQ4_9BACI|nr:ABC transporter permease [Priestia koreensis]KOO41144.1 ABC transporter permease [Priestia koreensis]